MTSHVIAYRSKELLFGRHAFNFNCFLDDFNCVFTQIRCLSVLLNIFQMERSPVISFLFHLRVASKCSKTCVKRPLSKRPKIGFQDQLSLNAGQKYCRMLQESFL